MSRKTLSTIAAALILTLFGVNAASAQSWDSNLSDGTVFVESNYSLEDQDPNSGIYYKPVSYFIIEGDELYIVHSGHPHGWMPSGPLPALSDYVEFFGQTFQEYLEDEGFEWDVYDLEDVQQIVFMGSEVGNSVRNATDIPSILCGGESTDYILGGSASDTIYGFGGNDRLVGNEGNDLLIGGTGDDELWGKEGNDTMYGNHGMDDLWGGEGADYFDFGYDTLEIGAQNSFSAGKIDTLVVNYRKSSVTGEWYPKLPTFLTYQGPVEYSESYFNSRTKIKRRYVSKYQATFYNPDMTRQSRGIDTSQIDLRR